METCEHVYKRKLKHIKQFYVLKLKLILVEFYFTLHTNTNKTTKTGVCTLHTCL